MSEKINPHDNKLGVGEILICNRETNGKFEQLKYFIGKVILTIGGGGDKIYVVEAKDKVSSEVKSIQSRTQDQMNNTETKFIHQSIDNLNSQSIQVQENNNNYTNIPNASNVPPEESKQNTIPNQNPTQKQNDDEAQLQIIQICKGKYHLVKLTSDGKVRCSGKPYFGVAGLGGSAHSDTTILLPNLANINIVQIAAGQFHSMALAENGDLYVWGAGFEGQLGLSMQYKVASSPKYLKYFYRQPIKFIACGHDYSMAITREGVLYGWGENKLGQLGLGHIQIFEHPMRIPIIDKPGEQEGCSSSESLVNEKLEREYTNKPLKVCYAAAGYSHSVIVTDKGIPVTFGLNIHGQLGLGNNITSFEPRLIEKDYGGEYIEKIVKASCSTTGTFLISESGKMYSCGSGIIGHGEIGMVKLPKIIGGVRQYSYVFCNNESVVAFSPLKILSVSPLCGPSTGNTILSIIGSAFKEFAKLSVRFIFNGISRDVKGTFDKVSRTIFVKTPNFLEYAPNIELPNTCVIQITFDGIYYTEYEDKFLIYPNNLKINQIEPRCGPTAGGETMKSVINLSQIPKKYLFSLTIGFQERPLSEIMARFYKSKKNSSLSRSNAKSLEDSKVTSSVNNSGNGGPLFTNVNSTLDNRRPEDIVINPMDIDNLESQLDKSNWYCCFCKYDNGLITCTIPKIDTFNQNQFEYNVDIAINGQQFSGYPMIYRFYDISVEKLEPNITPSCGGAKMRISGNGFFDCPAKAAKISSPLGERSIEIQWDKIDKSFTFDSCKLEWLSDDVNAVKSLNNVDMYKNYLFNVSLTLNGTHWVKAGSFRYYDIKVDSINYIYFKESQNLEERIDEISKPCELSEDEKVTLGLMEMYTDKKKLADYEKKVKDDAEAIAQYKKPYNGLALYGPFFPNVSGMKIRFTTQNGDVDVDAYYHNERKIACIIPEMSCLTPGQYEVMIFFTCDGQIFEDTEQKILFTCPEEGATFEDIVKGEEGDKKKKPGKK